MITVQSLPLAIAVVGVGHLGSIHTKLWREQETQGTSDSAWLAGIFDDNAEHARTVAQQHGVERVFSSLTDVLENADAICLVTPTSTHFEIAQQALMAGKHCFIEKPITSTYQEAVELVRLADEHQCVVHVGHVERFNPALQAVQKRFAVENAAENDVALSPLFIEAHRLAQFKQRATDVSVILDLMIHDIDIALVLARSPVAQIDANGVAILTNTPDIANARIRFENGCVANLTASRITQKPMRKTRIFQRDAYISMDFASGDVEVFRLMDEDAVVAQQSSAVPAIMLGNIEAGSRSDGRKRTIIFEKPAPITVNAIVEEQQAFIKAIRLGNAAATPPATTALEAAEALRVAEEITRQITTQPL